MIRSFRHEGLERFWNKGDPKGVRGDLRDRVRRRLTALNEAQDLRELNLIDGIVPEPEGGAQEDPVAAAEFLRQDLVARLGELDHLNREQLVNHRYTKFRRMGNFFA